MPHRVAVLNRRHGLPLYLKRPLVSAGTANAKKLSDF